MVLLPRESAKLITSLAKNVIIVDEGVKRLAAEFAASLKTHKAGIDCFSQSTMHPRADNPKASDWIFVVDTLNFCFWTKGNHIRWQVNGETGYFALCAAINRAVEDGIPILDPKYYATIKKAELENILRPDEGYAKIPLIDDRVKNLQEVGKVLSEKYNSTFVECIKQCEKSAEKLLKLIVQEFECFQDEANFEGHRVSFYKRAQILVADIWACFKGKDLGEFYDIDVITMFADYRVPQVLLYFGAMQYSKTFMKAIQSDSTLERGSNEEIEIRGCSIEVVERVLNEVRKLIKLHPEWELKDSDCNSIIIDHYLWDYRRQHAEELDHIPYHKTLSIFY